MDSIIEKAIMAEAVKHIDVEQLGKQVADHIAKETKDLCASGGLLNVEFMQEYITEELDLYAVAQAASKRITADFEDFLKSSK